MRTDEATQKVNCFPHYNTNSCNAMRDVLNSFSSFGWDKHHATCLDLIDFYLKSTKIVLSLWEWRGMPYFYRLLTGNIVKQNQTLIWIVFTWQQESVTSEDMPKECSGRQLKFYATQADCQNLRKLFVKIGIFLLMVSCIGEVWRRFEHTRRRRSHCEHLKDNHWRKLT